MAASRKPPTADPEAAVAGCLSILHPGDRLIVALSGGLDSMVLLHLCARLAPAQGLQLSALHVNHQISPHADAWAQFCQAACAALDVPLTVRRVLVVPEGQGIEAAARAARYQALCSVEAEAIVLAHHRDDQAETFLLQLLRGAGLSGLSAMPALRVEHGRSWLRPFLNLSRADLHDWASHHGVAHIEDESNLDVRFDRNYLRQAILPLITDRWPHATTTIARAAAHLAEAAALLADQAQADAALITHAAGLHLGGWRQLEHLRRRNVLRHYLAEHGMSLSARRFDLLQERLDSLSVDTAIVEETSDRLAGVYRGFFSVASRHPAVAYRLDWEDHQPLLLPDGVCLRLEPQRGAGIRAAALAGRPLVAASREGGERLQLASGRPHRTLKNLYQEAGIPPWQRLHPVLWCDGKLVAVVGIGIDAAFQAGPDEDGLVPVIDA